LSKKQRENGNDDLEVCVWNFNNELNKSLWQKMLFGLKSYNLKTMWKSESAWISSTFMLLYLNL
jgi:hypothetical protein